MANEDSPNAAPTKRPSRGWYVFSALLLLVSSVVFAMAFVSLWKARGAVSDMPRWVAPSAEGHEVEIDTAGRFYIYYENKGEIDGRAFDTPRRQVWMTYDMPSMTCTVTPISSDDSEGEALLVRLLGQDGREFDKRDSQRDIVTVYDFDGRQGAAVWVVEVSEPGRYRIKTDYVEAVYADPESIVVLPELTREQEREMTSADAFQYEKDQRAAHERLELARLEPVEVVLALGQDPTRGALFAFLGLRGAAGLLAVCFTAASIISLVTLMLRSGHVTQRGEMADVQRGMG